MFVVLDFLFLILHISVPAGSFPAPLSLEEERDCFRRLRIGESEARETLIAHNLRLVAHIVKKYYTTNDNQDDLISIGTIGLIKAIDSFNGEKQIRLATYAAKCINNEILMHFRSLKKTANDVSMNEEIDTDKDGNPLSLMDVLAEDDNIVETIYNRMQNESLRRAIATYLDDREKTIISLRYGLSEPALTQKETADRLGISRSYVSRLEKKALQTLKNHLKR